MATAADYDRDYDPDDISPLGELYSPDEGVSLHQRVQVLGGSGSWAYWIREEGKTHRVMADTIFNPKAPHFAGKLKEPFTAPRPRNAWLIIHGWVEPPTERKIYVEDEDEGLPRMERR